MNTDFNKLKCKLRAYPVLSPNVPMAYGEYMTYIEQVYAIYNITVELVELSEYLKNKVDNIDLNFQELQEQINEQNNRIEDLYFKFEQFRNEIENRIDSRIEQILNQVQVLMQQYQTIINADINLFKQDVNNRIDGFQTTLDSIIETGAIQAYDPTIGSMNDLNQVLSNLYGALRQDALTVAEFENLNLTCTGFEAKDITAYNFDVNGKSLLQ